MTDQNADNNYNALSKYAINLNDRARTGKLDPVIGRDEEIRRVLQILSRRTKNNPILIGEPGVGKTAILSPSGENASQRRSPYSGVFFSPCSSQLTSPPDSSTRRQTPEASQQTAVSPCTKTSPPPTEN